MMSTVTLAIEPLPDNKDLYIGNVKIFHVECDNAKVSLDKNQATKEYKFHCDQCGDLDITFPDNQDDKGVIATLIKTAINKKEEPLDTNQFRSDTVKKITCIGLELR